MADTPSWAATLFFVIFVDFADKNSPKGVAERVIMISLTKAPRCLCSATFLLIVVTLATARAETFKVAYVCDGDTVILSNRQHVRYIGINAPEVAHDRKPPEYFGNEARKYNKRLVLGKKVRLVFDQEQHDRHGRLLAYVYLEDGTFVNAMLVKEGYAHVFFAPPNIKYYKHFLALQREAIKAQKGMWPHLLGDSKGPYIGNIRAKKFHRPTCPFGKQTTSRNVVRLTTKKEAFMNGYSPCRRCRP